MISQRDKQLLRDSFPELIKCVTLNDGLVNSLSSRGAITEQDARKIKNMTTAKNADKFHELYGALFRGDSDTMDRLIYALEEFSTTSTIHKLLRAPRKPDIWRRNTTDSGERAPLPLKQPDNVTCTSPTGSEMQEVHPSNERDYSTMTYNRGLENKECAPLPLTQPDNVTCTSPTGSEMQEVHPSHERDYSTMTYNRGLENKDNVRTQSFNDIAKEAGLKPATIQILADNDYDSIDAIKTIIGSDLEELGLKRGQRGIVREWISKLLPTRTKTMPTEVPCATTSVVPNSGGETPAPIDTTSITGGHSSQGTSNEQGNSDQVAVQTAMSLSDSTSEDTGCWEKPLCLIEGKGSQVKINERTVELLSKEPGPLIVAGIVGLYRTGKSYLLNLLAGKKKGFQLSPNTDACTKGIWTWLVDHPQIPNCKLLLMDTEGLGDAKKGSAKHDSWIFSLSVLLSSILVYNSKGSIDNDALEKLHFVTNIADYIKINAEGKDKDEDIVSFFPKFVWAVRDVTLTLGDGKKRLTSDEYLESVLQTQEGASRDISEYNLPRNCIRHYFPSRACLTFPFPLADTTKLKDLEHMTNDQLSPGFSEVARSFQEHIYTSNRPKMLHGKPVTGRMFVSLVRAYVEAIQKGNVPCIQNAVETTANNENNQALKNGVELYKTSMAAEAQLPTTGEVLSTLHRKCEKEAIAAFTRVVFCDSDYEYQNKLKEALDVAYNEICTQNEEASMSKCTTLLDKLSSNLKSKLQAKQYLHAGGHGDYMTDINDVEQKYNSSRDKGVKASECWDKFMKDREIENAAIMMADETKTEYEKKEEEERQRNAAKEREQQLKEEEKLRLMKLTDDMENSQHEHKRQITEKLDEGMQLLKEQVAQLIQEKEKFKAEGQERKMEEQDRLIKAAQNQVEEMKKEQSKGKEGLFPWVFGKATDAVKGAYGCLFGSKE